MILKTSQKTLQTTIRYWSLNRYANKYRDADKSQLISWFNEKQKEWGITELIFQAVKIYAEELTA